MKKLCVTLLLATFVGCVDSAPPGSSAHSFPIINPDDPASISKWESSTYNFADAKIDLRKLRYLHGSLGNAEPKDSASVAIQVYGARSAGISPEQASAVNHFVENEEVIHEAVRSAVYAYYKTTYPAWKEGLTLGAAMYGGADKIDAILPKITNGDELDSLIAFSAIYVHPAKDGVSCIGLDLLIPFDEENGLGIRIQGEKVVTIGTAHEAFPIPDR